MPTEVGHLRSAYWLKTSGVWALHRQISAVFLVANFRASWPKHITYGRGFTYGTTYSYTSNCQGGARHSSVRAGPHRAGAAAPGGRGAPSGRTAAIGKRRGGRPMTGLELLVLLGLGGLVPIAGVLLVRRSYRRTWQQELVAYVLRFPRGLDPAAVVAFLGGLAGLVAPRHQRPFVVRAVVFETSATPAGIQHHLVVPRSLAHVVLSALRAALPGVSVRPDEDYQVARPALAAELGISDHHRSLVSDRAAAISNAILASLYPLDAGEQLVVQWSLSPLGPVPVAAATAEQSVAGGVWDLLRGQTSDRTIDPEVVKAARVKQQAPLFAATVRVGVVASPMRARSLLLRVLAAFHTANAPGVHLYRLSRSNNRVARGLSERRLPLASWPCTLNAAELAGLVAFPFGKVALPGLQLGGARQLAPASDIHATGRVVAEATFPGAERPLALS